MTDQQYMEIVKGKLSERRFKHSLAVAKEAKRLAQKYGCDGEKAYTAGILHDIMKDMPPDELLQMLTDFDIILCDIEKREHKLWHAIGGSAFMKCVLEIQDEDLLNSVRYHTTARADMSLLEKVLYLADFTSEDRDYEGVEQMRAVVEQGVPAAMEEALVFTVQDLAEKRSAIHPDTIAAYNQTILEKTTGGITVA